MLSVTLTASISTFEKSCCCAIAAPPTASAAPATTAPATLSILALRTPCLPLPTSDLALRTVTVLPDCRRRPRDHRQPAVQHLRLRRPVARGPATAAASARTAAPSGTPDTSSPGRRRLQSAGRRDAARTRP